MDTLLRSNNTLNKSLPHSFFSAKEAAEFQFHKYFDFTV